MSSVIDMKTRQSFQIEPVDDRIRDEQRVAALLRHCEDAVYAATVTIRAASGLDAALRMIGRVAEDVRNEGKIK